MTPGERHDLQDTASTKETWISTPPSLTPPSSASGSCFSNALSTRCFNSDNGGVTWSKPEPLHVQVPPYLSPNIKPAVGHGIQPDANLCSTQPCAHAGRLVMPVICEDRRAHDEANYDPRYPVLQCDSCDCCHGCPLYWDNHGESCSMGTVAQPVPRKPQVVQLQSGTGEAALYSTARKLGGAPGHRMYARSTADGRTLTACGINQTLVAPITCSWTGVVASIHRLPPQPQQQARNSNILPPPPPPSSHSSNSSQRGRRDGGAKEREGSGKRSSGAVQG